MLRTMVLVFLYSLTPNLTWSDAVQMPLAKSTQFEGPTTGQDVDNFVPKGWSVESDINKDLNGDGKVDHVLVLLENTQTLSIKSEPVSKNRILIILLKMRKPGFRRVGLATRLFHCTGCHGKAAVSEGDHPQIHIAKRELIVEETWGERETVNTRLRFRHDSRSGQVLMIGEDIQIVDRTTGARRSIKSNFLTGIKSIENDQFNLNQRKFINVNKMKQRIKKSLRRIEEIDYRDYERLIDQPEAIPQ